MRCTTGLAELEVRESEEPRDCGFRRLKTAIPWSSRASSPGWLGHFLREQSGQGAIIFGGLIAFRFRSVIGYAKAILVRTTVENLAVGRSRAEVVFTR